MSHGFTLPANYKIRPARNRTDRWAVYRMLTLEREKEVSHSKLVAIIISPYTSILLALLGFTLLLISFFFPLHHNLFYTLFILLSVILGTLSFFQVSFLYDLFLENERLLVIALHGEQVIGCSLMAFRKNYSVLLGLYVAPSHRRRGVGSYLIQYLLQRNALPTYLNTSPQLRSFYSRFGFVETNIKKGYNMVIQTLN